MKRFLSPKQAARSMGVSESSLKRWCDRGTLTVQKTAGGHRRIPISAIVKFVRDSGRELVQPELLGLPNQLRSARGREEGSVLPLANAFVEGDSDRVREIVFGHFFDGKSVAFLCDRLIAPAMSIIGDQWRDGDVEIFEEHRAVQMTFALLYQFKTFLPVPADTAPVALGASVEGDVYALPTHMIELVLTEIGYHATSLGASLPMASLKSAASKYRPSLVWLSASVIKKKKTFTEQLNQFALEVETTRVVLGGRAVTEDIKQQVPAAWCCGTVEELAQNAKSCLTATT
jgi:excisionase family DNA binding protein